MANNYFKFKQFTIKQERCAMKVGTDGCLLGAWADLSKSHKILDVGCGSGLIAIMSAQRCKTATIYGIEIDEEAAKQATENAALSPWEERLNIIHGDFLNFYPEKKFDTILSNPPYFTNSMKCLDNKRNKARHDDLLSGRELISHSYELLCEEGKLSIVIPAILQEEWQKSAEENGFTMTRLTYIHTQIQIPPKRVLVEFSKKKGDSVLINDFTLETNPGIFTDEAMYLLKDFYLKL